MIETTTLLGLPRPSSWQRKPFGPDGYIYHCPDGLTVIETRAFIEGPNIRTGDNSLIYDGQEWLHVSMSRKTKMPTYEDMVKVKRICIGNDRTALQIFPTRERHVNIYEFCLHLWCPLDRDVTPDFGQFGTI